MLTFKEVMLPSDRQAERHLAILLAILGVVFFTYRDTLGMALLGFDTYAVILASRIRGVPDLAGTFTEVWMDGRLPLGDFYRPVSNLSISLDYAIWGNRSLRISAVQPSRSSPPRSRCSI